MHVQEAQFEYADSLGAQHIRLLDLKYGKQDEDVQFSIQKYPLSAAPDYIALSYTWGNTKDTVPVLCEGKAIYITRSLRKALLHLRDKRKALVKHTLPNRSVTRPLYLWVDPICIRQSDTKEKSYQVGRMALIYQQACKVIVWLGPADKSSDTTMDYLNTLGAKAEACGLDRGIDPYREIWQEIASKPRAVAARDRSNIYMQSARDKITTNNRQAMQDLFYSICGQYEQENLIPIEGMKHLFTRPWWGRIWVLQEVTIPLETEFICGTKRIARRRCSAAIHAYAALWNVLLSSQFESGLSSYQRSIFFACFQHRPMIMLHSWHVYRFDRFSLAALLRLTCVGSHSPRRHGPYHLDSTDPWDKIYALLSIAADREELERMGVFPDYAKCKNETYMTTMAALLEQGHISLLLFCNISTALSDLPTWVMDWTKSMTHGLQDIENDHITVYPKFGVSGPGPHPKITAIRSDSVISVISYMYDEVYKVGSFPDRTSSREVPLLETFSWPVEWLTKLLHLTYFKKRHYSSFLDQLKASTRTSIGGVGFGPDKRVTRVGDDRLRDAISLLRSNVSRIKPRYLKYQIEKHLNGKSVENETAFKAWLGRKLDNEIIGKSLTRCPCVTAKGHLALSSEHVRQGDVIALLRGAQVPFILRRHSEGRYHIVSEAYVDGIMDGEAMDLSKCQAIKIV